MSHLNKCPYIPQKLISTVMPLVAASRPTPSGPGNPCCGSSLLTRTPPSGAPAPAEELLGLSASPPPVRSGPLVPQALAAFVAPSLCVPALPHGRLCSGLGRSELQAQRVLTRLLRVSVLTAHCPRLSPRFLSPWAHLGERI